MDDAKFEQMLTTLLQKDYSAGTESFRDALLERCLDELNSDFDCKDLSDNELEMLAAAGDMSIAADSLGLNNPTSHC